MKTYLDGFGEFEYHSLEELVGAIDILLLVLEAKLADCKTEGEIQEAPEFPTYERLLTTYKNAYKLLEKSH